MISQGGNMKFLKQALVFVSLAAFLAGLPAAADYSGKKIEFTLYGGFSIFSGTGTATDNPTDLYTGDWSPFFGAGYDAFSWYPTDIANLDSVIGNGILERKSSPQFGLKVGFRVSPRIQVEGFFEFCLSKFRFTDAAWGQYEETITESMDSLESFDRSPNATDLSTREEGKAMTFGLNVNIDLAMDGMVIPYVSLGGVVSLLQGFPSLDYALEQSLGSSSATYGFMLDYADVTAIGFGGGIGARIYMGNDMGIKIEARGTYLPIKAEQRFEATFDRVGTAFYTFPEYNAIAATEKINQFVITLNAGFFFDL
jgi:opacity protein-like surface antigen